MLAAMLAALLWAALPSAAEQAAELVLLSPNGGERLVSGQPIPLVWRSRGCSEITVRFYSNKIHKRGGKHTVETGFFDEPGTFLTRKSTRVPVVLDPSDDWTVRIFADRDAGKSSDASNGPFTVTASVSRRRGTRKTP